MDKANPLSDMLAARRIQAVSRRRYQRPEVKWDVDRWVARYREDVLDPNTGQVMRPRKVWYGDGKLNKRAAQKELDQFLGTINHESYKPSVAETFAGFADRWVKNVMIHHKPSTQHSEGSIIRVHLKPSFGQFQMKEITAEVLQSYVSSSTVSQKTTRNIVDCLRVMWTTAKDWHYVQHDPFQGLRKPKKTKPNTYSFSLEESIAIIERAAEPWKTLIRMVAESGVRSGEVAGLRIEDFDPVNLTLAVRQSVWNKRIQTPKSDAAFRREPISAELAYAIEQVIKTAKPNRYGLIFTGQTGEPLQMIHFINRVFAPILRELGIRAKLDAMGIKKCGLHAFRRMSGREMDRQGVPLKTRQARMGHSHPSVTLEHYTEPIDEASRRFADRMGVLLAPKRDGEQVQ